MIKHLIIIVLLLNTLLAFVGCNEQKSDVNPNIIPKEKFVKILAECQLAEAQVNVLRILQPYYKDSILNYYAAIFESNDITSEAFYYSLKEYSRDPVQLDSIYAQSIVILQKKASEIGELEENAPTLNAISRQDLGDLIIETPIAKIMAEDSNYVVLYYKDTLMHFLDSNKIIYEAKGYNRESVEFTFVLNTSNRIMFNQLKEYIIGKMNASQLE
jgi:hypothetical protein